MRRSTCLMVAALSISGLSAPAISAQSFGSGIVVEGNEVLVGEPAYDMRSGVVYVFERDANGDWARSQRLEPADGEAGNRFGIRLARQGDLLLVSATRADAGTGAIYTFRKTGGSWQEAGRLVTDDRSPADSLGTGLAIDGDWIALSTIAQSGGRGAAYLFRRSGDAWTQHSKLVPEGLEEGVRFGSKIALADGHMLVATTGTREIPSQVFAYHFDAATDSWVTGGTVDAPLNEGQTGFGADMALVGGTALIGAPGFFSGTGSVFVYQRMNDSWSFASMLTPYQSTGGTQFGGAVTFDGATAMIGARGAGRGEGRVFAYAYDPDTGEWTGATQFGAEEDGRLFFGSGLAMTDEVGVGVAAGGDRGAGVAWVYDRDATGWSASSRLAGDVLGMDAVMGDEVSCSDEGQAAGFDCSSVDLISFLPVPDMGAERGVRTNDLWGWTDSESGREIALVGMTNQLAFVDVSNASQPTYLGRLPMTEGARASSWRDMKVYRDHVFVVSDGAGDHGMQVFDLTRLRGLDGSDPVTFEADAHYDRIASAHNIVINEETGFAYSVGSSAGGETCGGGLHMIDIRNPKSPTFAGCFQDTSTGRQRTGYSHDAQCVVYRGPDPDYAGHEICLGSNETALSIADVTDKAAPVAVSMASYPNVGYSHQGWLSEDQRYFFMNDELDEIGGNVESTRTLVWDLTDLDDPILAREYFSENRSSDHNLYVRGNIMYQSNYVSGLRVLDVSDPENPRPVGFFDTVPYGEDQPGFAGSWSNYPYFQSGLVIVTSGSEGLFLVRYRPRTISQ